MTELDAGSVRRLVPARDDLRPLYVTGYQLAIGKSGGLLQIKEKGKVIQEARLNEISQVNLFGPIVITGAAVQALIEACQPPEQVESFRVDFPLLKSSGLIEAQ